MRRKLVAPLTLKNCGQTIKRFRTLAIFCVGKRSRATMTYVLLSDHFMRRITMAPISMKWMLCRVSAANCVLIVSQKLQHLHYFLKCASTLLQTTLFGRNQFECRQNDMEPSETGHTGKNFIWSGQQSNQRNYGKCI